MPRRLTRKQAEALAKSNPAVRERLERGEFDDERAPARSTSGRNRARSRPDDDDTVRVPARKARKTTGSKKTGRNRAATGKGGDDGGRRDDRAATRRDRDDDPDSGGFFRGLISL